MKGQKGCEFDRNGYRNVNHSSTLVTIDAGTFRRIKGRINEGRWPSPSMIASLYRIDRGGKGFVGSQKVDINGWFCFGDLPAGKYLMKLGGERVLETADVKIILAPGSNRARREPIEIHLEPAI